MSSITIQQFEKLPKFAQEHIKGLCREIERLEEKVEIATNQWPTSGLSIQLGAGKQLFLPDKLYPVRFNTGPEHFQNIDVFRSQAFRDGIIVMGHNTIEVIPSASNLIHVRLRDK